MIHFTSVPAAARPAATAAAKPANPAKPAAPPTKAAATASKPGNILNESSFELENDNILNSKMLG